ncbi:MAG: hypothetical protein WCR96_06215 [Candidatus Methanomethylophilaceae archaeon]
MCETSYPGYQSIFTCVSCTDIGNANALTTSAAAYVKMHYISMIIDGDSIVAVTYPKKVV